MEINIFSWLEIKNKLYGKTLQTVDNFLSDMKFHIEWAPRQSDEITEQDIITMEDYKYLSDYLLSDKMKLLIPRVNRDYPWDEYEVLHELMGTPHYNVHIWVQVNFMERKLMPLPEGFLHPWKPNAMILAMTQLEKSERLRRSMEKLNKNGNPDAWWYQYNYWTGLSAGSVKFIKTWTDTADSTFKIWIQPLKKKEKGKTYQEQLKELYLWKDLPNMWIIEEPKVPDIKMEAKYWIGIGDGKLSGGIGSINHL